MNSVRIFSLPKDGLTYTESVFKRCKDLIAFDIWSGLELWKLDGWINNFKSPEERYFAACVLDVLVYRTDSQAVSLMQQLIQRTIPDIAMDSGLPKCLAEFEDRSCQSASESGFRIVPVLKPNDPPTKSGPVLTRMLKRHLDVSQKWIVFPQNLQVKPPQSVEAILFVDDFLGTGHQFEEFIKEWSLEQLITDSCCVYAPLVGHESGVKLLGTKFPNLKVCPVEVLGDEHAIFNEAAGIFPDGENTPEIAREFYYELLRNRGIQIHGPNRRGYGHLELTVAFENAVPDNSLPILWWNKSQEWKRLFNR